MNPVILALLFGLADGFAASGPAARIAAVATGGRSLSWLKASDGAVVSASILLAAALAVLGGFTLYGPRLALLALGFAVWRWEGWRALGGNADARTPAQRMRLLERQALAVPVFVLAVGAVARFGMEIAAGTAGAMMLFACYATLLGMFHVAMEESGEGNGPGAGAGLAGVRGLGLGLLLGIALDL